MGCGKSKHDVVASGNTVLKRKKSSVKGNKDQEIEAQTKDDNNNNSKVNVNNVNVNSGVVEKQKDGDNNVVKEVVVGGKVDDIVDSNNGVKRSKTENAGMVEETAIQKNNDIVAGEINANGGEEKVLEKSEKVVVSGGDNKVERSNGEYANEGDEMVVEKREEQVVGVVADKFETKNEETDVKEEEVKEEEKKDKEVDREEGLVPMEVSEKSQVEEDDDALQLNENDQKVNDAPVAEENKNGDAKDDVSVKEEAPKDIINVAASEGEEEKKKFKAEEQKENHLSNEGVKAN